MAAFTCTYECISQLILSRTTGHYISRLMMYIFVDSCWVLNVFYHPQFIPVWATILLSSLPLEVKTRKLLSQWPAVMINLASWVTVNRWDDTCKSGVNGPAMRRRNLQRKRKKLWSFSFQCYEFLWPNFFVTLAMIEKGRIQKWKVSLCFWSKVASRVIPEYHFGW